MCAVSNERYKIAENQQKQLHPRRQTYTRRRRSMKNMSLKLLFLSPHPHNRGTPHASPSRKRNANRRARCTPLFTEGDLQSWRIWKDAATPLTLRSWHVRHRRWDRVYGVLRSTLLLDPTALLASADVIFCLRNVCTNSQAEKISKLYQFDAHFLNSH